MSGAANSSMAWIMGSGRNPGEPQGHRQTGTHPATTSRRVRDVAPDAGGTFWLWRGFCPRVFARVTFLACCPLAWHEGWCLATTRIVLGGHRHRASVWRCPSAYRCPSRRPSSPDRVAPPVAVCPPGVSWDVRPGGHEPGPPAAPVWLNKSAIPSPLKLLRLSVYWTARSRHDLQPKGKP
jgi:hypothetical protein